MKPELIETAQRWVKRWKLKVSRDLELLDEIPHPGLAKASH